MSERALEIHKYAEAYPAMGDKDYAALVLDIKERIAAGQPPIIHKIKLFKGEILDGRNRYLALRENHVKDIRKSWCEELPETTNPLTYVVSANNNRRHLTTEQRAMAAAKIVEFEKSDGVSLKIDANRARVKSKGQPKSKEKALIEDAAEANGVSTTSVRKAQDIIESGSKPLKDLVERGEVKLDTAKDFIAAVPNKEQQEAVIADKGVDAVKEKAKEVRTAVLSDKAKKKESAKVDKPSEPATEALGPMVKLKAIFAQVDPIDAVRLLWDSLDHQARGALADAVIMWNHTAYTTPTVPLDEVDVKPVPVTADSVVESMKTVWAGGDSVEQARLTTGFVLVTGKKIAPEVATNGANQCMSGEQQCLFDGVETEEKKILKTVKRLGTEKVIDCIWNDSSTKAKESLLSNLRRKWKGDSPNLKWTPEDAAIPSNLDDPRFHAAWAEWCKDRRKRNKKLTEVAVQKQMDLLSGWGLEAALMSIDQAIRNGYLGLFSPKDDSLSTRQRDLNSAIFEGDKDRTGKSKHDL